ncbi:MAG: M48 family metallopeptidase [Siculibacillus sp.]|nr:M48 family metallopeptidase [Siculibacillus sp.]
MFGFTSRSTSRTAPPDHLIVVIAGRDVPVAVRISSRATRLTLRMSAGHGDPVLTLPRGVRLADAIDFLERHRGWLAERLARRPSAVAFVPGAVVPLRGEPHLLDHRPDRRGTVWIEPATGDAETPLLCVAGRPEHLARRVRDFLRRTAQADLAPAVSSHAARLGVRTGAIRIKDTRSRWGSCTAEGELSFSWRVILAPPHVLDYLAAHEVAHLREMNHSIRFWRLVRETCPRMDEGRRWLKLHGAALHSYGAG